jgi:adenylate kinase
LRIGITGSPGTGKKSVGKELSKILNCEPVFLNELAIESSAGYWKGRGYQREFIVDVEKIRKKKIETKNRIVIGHLLPYVLQRKNLDFVAILRCSPRILKRRYKSRRYGNQKIEENLLAEVLDVISFEALKTFGKSKVAEFDTSDSSAKASAEAIYDTIRGKRRKRYGIFNERGAEFAHLIRTERGSEKELRAKSAISTKKVISL